MPVSPGPGTGRPWSASGFSPGALVWTALWILLSVVVPAPAGAQERPGATVAGRVVEVGSDRPVAAASIALQGTEQVTTTAQDGRFSFEDVALGTYALTAEHLSYRTVVDTVHLTAPATYDVVVRLAVDAIELAGIDVQVRTAGNVLTDVREREERMERLGLGNFYGREEIAESGVHRLSHLLGRLPGARLVPISGRVAANQLVLSRRYNCTPSYYLDGLQISAGGGSVDDIVPLSNIESVEVYRRMTELPGEFGDERSRRCGAVAIWTRRGTDAGEPFGWARMLTAGAFLGAMVLSTSLWF